MVTKGGQPCQVCYLHAPGKLIRNETRDLVCPNSSCGLLIGTNYTDHTCSSCSQFLQVSRGTVIAKIDLTAIKPFYGGARSRDGRLLPIAPVTASSQSR